MKVRRLELSGFKSFAERTVMDFPQGLCAVVGPNGCGKSNVVDAVRWVLGEQSARQLRGRAMEDLIFNGSSDRSPTGVSEVSLTFENEGDITAPQFADLSEIQVTRRLYRSGESEYLINKVACRLKDINQLFMDTGLGNRDYAIIEQGRVASFIESRPEERRLWVEEAAGITRYKNQKKVSLRKMQATKENLDRQRDIIVELETQMKRLERQAKKAEVNKKLRDEIRNLDLNLSSFDFQAFTDQIKELSSEGDAVGARLLLAKKQVMGLETELETMRVQLTSAEQEISQAGARRLESQGEIQRLEHEVTHLGRETQSTQRHIERFESESQGLGQKIEQAEKDLAHAQRLVATRQSRQADSDQVLAEATAGLTAGQEALQEAENALDEAKTRVVDHLGRQTRIKNRLSDLTRSQDDLSRRRSQVDQRRDALQEQVDQAGQARQEAADEAEELSRSLAESAGQMESLEQDRDQAAESLTVFRQAEREAGRRFHDLSAAVDALSLSLASHDWAADGVRTLMDAAAAGETPVEIRGVAAEKLSAQPGYEDLVEVALGPVLQTVVVRDGRDARQLAAWVESHELSGVHIAALDELAPAAAAPPAGVLPLDRHVTTEPGFEALAQLVSGVGWCESSGEAWLAAKNLGPGQLVVSRTGQRMDRMGLVKVGRPVGGSVLVRRNELKQKQDELAQAQRDQAAAAENVEAAEAELAALEEELRRVSRFHRERSAAERQAQQELFRLEEGLAAHLRQLEALSLEEGELDQELARIRQEAESQKQELATLEETGRLQEARLEQAREELNLARAALEEARRVEAGARVAAAAQAAETQHAEAEVTRISRELASDRERLEALSAELSGAGRTVTSLGQRREQTQAKLAELYVEFDRREEALKQARDLYNQAQVRVVDLESALKQAREQQRKVEAESQDISWNRRETELKREQLAEQVMERCRVDLAADHERFLPADSFHQQNARERLTRLRNRLARMGPVNMEAISEHEAVSKRHAFLTEQYEDLNASLEDLRSAIRKINRTSRGKFLETLEAVNERLQSVFPVLFGGGQARLELEGADDPLEAGLNIAVQLPGKKIRHLESLSGGEKTMTAVAVLFALFLIRPAPFCLLDEVDAPLDETNIGRFHKLLQQLSEHSQILMVTHNRRTMEIVNMLYGVTMEMKGISKILAVSLSQGEAMAA